MHELRTWAVSAVVAAGLLGLTVLQFLPLAAATWVVVGLAWLVLTGAVHLLLHNRYMHALDDRLQARRHQTASLVGRGPAHATHRTLRTSGRSLERDQQTRAARTVSVTPPPAPQASRTVLPPLRPVASRSAGATRYHRPGSSSGRARTGRAAHR